MKIVLTKSFERDLKKLRKRFHHVKDDAQRAIEMLAQTPELGNAIPDSGGIRKLRVANTDLTKGKSGGYRLLYLLVEEPKPALFLLSLYAKSDRANVTRQELLDEMPVKSDLNDETPSENNGNRSNPSE